MADNILIANRFERLEEIGAGAMGIVYLGRDTFDDSKVAIKELKPDVIKENPELVERFTREGEALRKLNHPSIVKVLASVDEDDNHYIVMEYVDGGSLRELMDETKQMPINQILDIALDLSDALARAHRLNIIHRDIKPANVLIASDGTPRLTDFGIARIGDTSQMTQTGVIMGTLAYLPPEALSGIHIDHRADIWAFGVMLYEMCSGIRPFQADSTGGLVATILKGSVPDLLQYRPYEEFGSWGLPGLIYWMLEKDRENRPDSARLVGAMVENLLSGKELPSWNWFGDSSGSYDGGKEYGSDSQIPLSPAQAAKAAREFTSSGFRLEDLKTEVPASDSDSDMSVSAHDGDWTADPTISRSDWSISVKRKIAHKPRIFISYRRSDSIAITGRLYDRLVLAFGQENVFRDVEDIPAGADFKKILEDHIAACDVALVMIGPKWLNAANEKGRRLEDESDFVRIEVEAALGIPHKLVVPVLLEGVEMPEERLLPSNMKSLIYRNAAPVRNDPDFNRDAEWLINQIHNAFEYERPKRKIGWQTYALIASVLLIIMLGAFLTYNFLSGNFLRANVAAFPDSCDVAVVGEDETMVLIAKPERIEGQARDVQSFIFEDLHQDFEQTVPFSKIRIRASNTVVTNDADAHKLAVLCHASVIIWGRYDASRSFMNVQLGDAKAFPNFVFSEDSVRSLTDAEYIMTDELTQTLAFGVITVLEVAAITSNDVFSVAANLVIGGNITASPAEVQGSTPAARYHRFIPLFIFDPQAALTELNKAIDIVGNNPVLYTSRGILYQRLGNIPASREDNLTAQSLGPANWVAPKANLANDFVYFQDDFESALPLLGEALKANPDDWFLNSDRGLLNYILGNYEAAKPDIERALANHPVAIWPYQAAVGLALRDADFVRAQELLNESKTNYPNPAFSEKIVSVTLNEEAAQSELIPFFRAFTDFILERWPSVISDTDGVLNSKYVTSDLYFLRGFAYCNQRDYPSAEDAYTKAIEIDPNFPFLYFLRAEVRYRQGGLKLAGAAQDLAKIASSDQADLYKPFTSRGAALMDEMSCENFLTIDLSQFGFSTESGS